MTGRLSQNAKITRSSDQGFTKMIHPYPVDDHACGQRVGGSHNRFGELGSTAALLEVFAGLSLNDP